MSYIGNSPLSVAFLTDTFSGNGSTVAFTMSVAPANTSSILVAVTGVVQDPSTYSVSGTTLTFSAAPPSGTSNISVRYLGIPASGVTTTAYRTVTDNTATAGQTTFTIPSYTVGYVDVFRNGVRLAAADFTATTGTTVVLTNPASAGDTITTVSFYVSSVLNAIPATAGSISTAYLADASVTQAKLASNVAGNGPAFSAKNGSGQGISNNTRTVLSASSEDFDTASCYNNTGSTVGGIPAYAFLPNVAGYYQVNLMVGLTGTSVSYADAAFMKNGSVYRYAGLFQSSNTFSSFYAAASAVIYMNGTTDYLQAAGYITASSGQTLSVDSFWSASLIRSA